MSNVIHATFGDKTAVKSLQNAWQYDYGQILYFDDLELPDTYTVHFSNDKDCGSATASIGDSDGVAIPDTYLQTGETVYAFVYLHTGEDDGETEYAVTIYVNKRPEPTDIEPTPEEQSTIDQLIALLTSATEQTASDAESASSSATSASGYAETAQTASESAQEALETLQSATFSIDEYGHIIYSEGSDS